MPIFDQGYQHWSGKLSGHAWRWLAITRRGVRTALQGRIVRLVLLVAWVPALVLVLVLCLWGLVERQSDLIESIRPLLTSFLGRPILAGPREYRVEIWTLCFHYFLSWELWFSMVLVLLVGPNLISQDLRYNALPLYFSRPLRRIDYFVGKLGVIVALLGMVIIVPCAGRVCAGAALQPRHHDRARHVAHSAGQRDLWPGDCGVGRDADAGALVAVAQFAVCRAVLDGDLDRHEHRVVDPDSSGSRAANATGRNASGHVGQ